MAPFPSKIEPRVVPSTEWIGHTWRDGQPAEEQRGGVFIEPNIDTTCFSIRQINDNGDEDDLIHICSWPELRATIDRFMDDRAAEAGLEAVAELADDYLRAGIIRRPE